MQAGPKSEEAAISSASAWLRPCTLHKTCPPQVHFTPSYKTRPALHRLTCQCFVLVQRWFLTLISVREYCPLTGKWRLFLLWRVAAVEYATSLVLGRNWSGSLSWIQGVSGKSLPQIIGLLYIPYSSPYKHTINLVDVHFRYFFRGGGSSLSGLLQKLIQCHRIKRSQEADVQFMNICQVDSSALLHAYTNAKGCLRSVFLIPGRPLFQPPC